MKLKLFIVAISSLVVNVYSVMACYHPPFQANGYTMFRATDEAQGENKTVSQQNCLAWQAITGSLVSLDDIYQVVYKYSLEEIANIIDSPTNNEFAKWISESKDTEIVALLTLAKECEQVRHEHLSPWYYPCQGDEIQTSLQNIAQRAKEYNGDRLKDRYALQYIRATFSLSQYEECIAYWELNSNSTPKGVISDMIDGYVAGAYARTAQRSKSLEFFIKSGDVDSAIAVADDSVDEVDIFRLIYKYTPNSQSLISRVQELIQSHERKISSERVEYCQMLHQARKPLFMKLKQLALQIAKEGRCDNAAVWYYTAAFISELYGDSIQAEKLLCLAERAVGNTFLDDSIQVLRIYLDAKLLPYNASYEIRLYDQLKWLTLMADANLTDEVRERSKQRYYMLNNESYFYWNDMLRRIVLGEVCPRMLKCGKTTKAIQLANMAEYRLLKKIDYKQTDTDTFNKDYATYLFAMVDTLNVEKVVNYTAQMNNVDSKNNRLYNEGSLVDDAYWNNIIGTKYLRDGRYKEAKNYLDKVSAQFEDSLNTASYMGHDPFSIEREWRGKQANLKLNFAQKMYELECSFTESSNANDKAEKMIEYAVGLRSSHSKCWALAYYYWGAGMAQSNKLTIQKAISKSEQLIQKAFNTYTNPDKAAEAHYKFGNYKTIIEEYPQTPLIPNH